MPYNREQLLDRIYDGADHLWLRKRAITAAIVILLVGVAGALAVIVNRDNDGERVATTQDSLVTSTIAPTPTVTTPEPTTTAVVAPTPTTATAGGATATTAVVCRNSTSDACGAFRWDPNPGANAPLTATVTWAPEVPHVGDEVVFTVHADDPDASPIFDSNCAGGASSAQFGDDGAPSGTFCAAACNDHRRGPWTPPARQRGENTFVYRHVYRAPGAYQPRFGFFSATAAGGCPANPYGSTTRWVAQLTVVE